jgi:hypothetical protein
MIQMLLMLILLITVGLLSIIAIVFLVISVIRWKRRKNFKIPLLLFIFFGVLALLVINIDLTSAEATDREDSIPAFESNFGFKPPSSVKEIMHKNFFLYDASVHWMSFTYDSIVFNQILIHDQPLLVAKSNSPINSEIVREFAKENPNNPNWFELPTSNSVSIYYKKDFLDHTFSEYYLWHSDGMVYLMVHYFD